MVEVVFEVVSVVVIEVGIEVVGEVVFEAGDWL